MTIDRNETLGDERDDLPGDERDDMLDPEHWPLHWHGLDDRDRWLWFERLWFDVCRLRDRYELPIRSGWWESSVAIEALAAFAAWLYRYDGGIWNDPPGKLALLYDLERLRPLLRDGNDPFFPDRDRPAFIAHLIRLGCRPPESEVR